MQTLRGTKCEFGKLYRSPTIIDHEMRGVRNVCREVIDIKQARMILLDSRYFFLVKWISIDRWIFEILLQRIVDLGVWRGGWYYYYYWSTIILKMFYVFTYCIIINYTLSIIILLFLDCFNLYVMIFHLNLIKDTKSKNTLNKGSYHIAEIFEHFSSHRISLKNQMK